MKYFLLCAGLLFFWLTSQAQILQRLEYKFKKAKTDKEKIYALDSLAVYYTHLYIGTKDSLGNAYGREQLEIAEKSRDNELRALALLLNGSRLASYWNVAPSVKQADSFLVAAIQFSKVNNLPHYEASACLHLATAHNNLIHGINNDKALEYAHQALGISASISNDSLKVLATSMIGEVQQGRKNYVMAFRSHTAALREAERLHSIRLQIGSNFALGYLYQDLGDYEKAVDYHMHALALSKRLHNPLDIFTAYTALAQSYTAAKNYTALVPYLEELYHLTNSHQFPSPMRSWALFLLYNAYIGGKHFQKAKDLYEANPEMAIEIGGSSLGFYMDLSHAQRLETEGKLDSAEYYYKRSLNLATDSKVRHILSINDLFFGYGGLLLKLGRTKDAIYQFEQAKATSEELQDLTRLKEAYHRLDTAYALLGNKSSAYDYHLLHDKYRDSLEQLADQKQLTLLEVDNESKRLQLLKQQEEERTRKRHHLQYMGITAGIAAVFIILTLLGFFSTSTAVIRGLGFFAFIFFFEFIILLADHLIHQLTHGEPWKVLTIKIGLIAFLLPFHHYIEKRVVNYLVHRKKIQLHTGLLRRRKPVVATVPLSENEEENEKQNLTNT